MKDPKKKKKKKKKTNKQTKNKTKQIKFIPKHTLGLTTNKNNT